MKQQLKHHTTVQQYSPIFVYLLIWLISYAVFFLIDPGDAMGYWIIFFWGVLPAAAIVSSAFIGINKNWSSKAVVPLGIFYGIMYMMAPYMTFKMANYRAQIAAVRDGLPMPDFYLLLAGTVLFIIGYVIGRVISIYRNKLL